MSALQDESVQQRGQVIIFYEVGRSLGQVKHLNRSSSYSAYQDALPMNVQSIHFCYSDSTLQGVISIILHFLNKRNRIRFRDHCGTYDIFFSNGLRENKISGNCKLLNHILRVHLKLVLFASFFVFFYLIICRGSLGVPLRAGVIRNSIIAP